MKRQQRLAWDRAKGGFRLAEALLTPARGAQKYTPFQQKNFPMLRQDPDVFEDPVRLGMISRTLCISEQAIKDWKVEQDFVQKRGQRWRAKALLLNRHSQFRKLSPQKIKDQLKAYGFRNFASLGGIRALKVDLFEKLLELKAKADAGV